MKKTEEIKQKNFIGKLTELCEPYVSSGHIIEYHITRVESPNQTSAYSYASTEYHHEITIKTTKK